MENTLENEKKLKKALDGVFDSFDELKRMTEEMRKEMSESFDNMIKEMTDDKNASLLKREWRRLAKIDIN
jgi:hypothetical protein